MPNFAGAFTSNILGGAVTPGMQSLWDDGRPAYYAPSTVVSPIAGAVGVFASGQPSSEAMISWPGAHCASFSDDYYHRIYLQPSRIEFGNLVIPTTRTVEIWNAFLDPVTIIQLDGDTDGFSLEFFPPARMRGLANIFYEVTATLDGPSFVDTLLTIHFSAGGMRTLAVSYGRVLVMGLLHDWQSGFTERLEWLTDVLTMRDGGEQRVITFWLCEAAEIQPLVTAAFVGITGHMGSRAIFLIESWAEDHFGRATDSKSATEKEQTGDPS